MQNADGTAHIAYYDVRGEGYSYVWDGKSPNIQVCVGGYGEPVDHTIPAVSIWQVDNLDWPVDLTEMLSEFEDTCAQHTNELLRHDGRVAGHHSKFIRQLISEGPAIGQTHL